MSAREVLQAVRLPMEIVDGDDGRKVILYGEIGPQGIDAILSALEAAGYAVVPKSLLAKLPSVPPMSGLPKVDLSKIDFTAAKETP